MKKTLFSLLLVLSLLLITCVSFAENEPSTVALYGDGGILWYYTDHGISAVTLNIVTSDNNDQTFGELLNFDHLFSVHADYSVMDGWMVYGGTSLDVIEEYSFDDNVLCYEIQSGFYLALNDYEICYEGISTEELALLTCEDAAHIIIPSWYYEDSGEYIYVPAITLFANGGEMLYHGEDEDYGASVSVSTIELGQTFDEVLDTDSILSYRIYVI